MWDCNVTALVVRRFVSRSLFAIFISFAWTMKVTTLRMSHRVLEIGFLFISSEIQYHYYYGTWLVLNTSCFTITMDDFVLFVVTFGLQNKSRFAFFF